MASGSSRKNKGRQKVKMERMEKDSNRQVTFSKRRCGLFKKASELCTLTGAEAAIIVFSPGKKVFSFGHPSVEKVVDRFLLASPPPKDGDGDEIIEDQDPEMQQDEDIQNLNMELTMMNKRIEEERKRSEELTATRKARAQHYWWDVPVEELGLEDLKRVKATLEELKNHVYQHGNKLMMETSSNIINPNAPQFMGMLGPTPTVGYTLDGNFYAPNFGFGY